MEYSTHFSRWPGLASFRSWPVPLLLALLQCFVSTCGAVTFTRIAHSQEYVPGMPGVRWLAFGKAELSEGSVYFSTYAGIFGYSGGTFTVIADEFTSAPEVDATFGYATFGPSDPVAAGGGQVVFETERWYSPPSFSGVFLSQHGQLSALATDRMPFPGRTGNHRRFRDLSIDGDAAVFVSLSDDHWTGLFRHSSGILSLLYQQGDPMPGSSDSFGTNSTTSAVFDGTVTSRGKISFRGYGTGGHVGLYTNAPGTLAAVADTSTAIPEGVGQFSSFPSQQVFQVADGGSWALTFSASGPNGQSGIYTSRNGVLARVVDESTTVSGFSSPLNGLVVPCVGESYVAFSSTAPLPSPLTGNGYGLFYAASGTVRAVLVPGDTLDGRMVRQVTASSSRAAEGARMVLRILFTDDTTALYLADGIGPSAAAEIPWPDLP